VRAFTGFALKSLKDYSFESLLDSQVPEEIILAVLADFRKHKLAEVLRRILERLQEVGQDKLPCASTCGNYPHWPVCVT
jgi:hypothetical protein